MLTHLMVITPGKVGQALCGKAKQGEATTKIFSGEPITCPHCVTMVATGQRCDNQTPPFANLATDLNAVGPLSA